ncbi:MAG: hypothetical protein K2L37_02115, partial [Lactobacillus sp.]|nr:hypothetical protein [Lactobacillus sp.]
DLIEDYRAGDINTKYDTTLQKVVKTSARGTQENPYVISTVDEWTRFAKNLDDGSIPNYGRGKYFVLANDIDFGGKTFYPVRFFDGTFYGYGKKLQNISVSGASGWVYWNGSTYTQIPVSGTGAPLGYGVFCATTTGAMITDLILENYKLSEMPQTAVWASRGGTNTGGIVGASGGNDYFLNCHISGTISSNISYNSVVVDMGGLVGSHIGTNMDITFYRCSSEVEISYPAVTIPIIGGLLGEIHNAGYAYVYDCVTNLKQNTVGGRYNHSSSIIGLVENSGLISENFVGTMDLTSAAHDHCGALTGFWSGIKTISIKNAYSDALAGSTDANKLSVYMLLGNKQPATSGFTNLNNVKSTSSYIALNSGVSDLGGNSVNTLSSSSDLINKIKSDLNSGLLSDRIWDENKIGGLYDPDNSPVRNHLFVNVRYYNRTLSGGAETLTPLCYTATNGGEYQALKTGAVLDIPQAKDTNHKFVGWSTEKDSWKTTYTTTIGLASEVDLYAVWEYTGNTTQSISVTNATVD